MPPRAKITKDMIIDAAFEIARESGAENINARTVSRKLGCSTQPVMWNFKTIADIRKTVYEKADCFHSEYIMDIQGDDPLMAIGLNYIRFAANEKNLFRFIFQSNVFSGKSLSELTDRAELMPIYNILAQEAQTDPEQAKKIFKSLFLYVHGYASMLANNTMSYNEEELSKELELIFEGAVHAAGRGADRFNEKTSYKP